jgi:glycosyltransferase involved in cell wall biosynthesis
MSAIRVVEVVGNSEGGGTRFVASLLEQMDPARYTTTLVAPDARWLRDLCAQRGVAYRPLPLMASRMDPSLGRDFDAILREAHPQLVHAHGTRAAWFTARRLPARAARRQQPAFLYSEHLFSCDARRGVARLPWYAIERYICQRADLLTTSCRTNAARALRAHWTTTERIALDHYGIDLQAIHAQATRPCTRGELGLPADGVLIGSLGRLIPQKGFGDLLDALALTLPRHPTVTCLIVGDGPLRGTLERQCRALGLERQVQFVGAHQEPWRVLALCELVALSSLFDGLALTLLEALAAGVPVVTTQAGGAAEVVTSGQNGLVVPPGNPVALAAGIERMLGDAQLRAACRANGPPSVQSYEALVALKQLLGAYEALAAQVGSRSDCPVSAGGQ